MTKIYHLLAFLSLSILIFSACFEKIEPSNTQEEAIPGNVAIFDQALADSLGADAYGMRKYVMAFLKSGPNRTQDSITRAKLQRAHLDNIGKLAEEGKLSLAGPFLDDGEIRGIYIFNVESIDEARDLTNTDPAIQAGSLIMELHPWYGSAALMDVNRIHKKIAKEGI
jgi:uncharacterized protein YciI